MKIGRIVSDHTHRVGRDAPRDPVRRAVDNFRQSCRLQLSLERPREIQKSRDEPVHAVRLAEDESGQLTAGGFRVRALALQQFGGTANGAQRIAKLVRQARRKLAQRRQPVRTADMLFGFTKAGVGDGQIPRRGLRPPCFRLAFARQLIRQKSDHRIEQDAESDLAYLLRRNFVACPIQEQ